MASAVGAIINPQVIFSLRPLLLLQLLVLLWGTKVVQIPFRRRFMAYNFVANLLYLHLHILCCVGTDFIAQSGGIRILGGEILPQWCP